MQPHELDDLMQGYDRRGAPARLLAALQELTRDTSVQLPPPERRIPLVAFIGAVARGDASIVSGIRALRDGATAAGRSLLDEVLAVATRPAMRRRAESGWVFAAIVSSCADGRPRSLDATTAVDASRDAGALDEARRDASVGPTCGGPFVTLGTGLDAWEELPCTGARIELVAGPQGGWHVHGRIRMRGITPDVFVSFSLVPEAGGASVTLTDEVLRRSERRGLVRVGDGYESTAAEFVILGEGERPPAVVGRRFRFGVRVERPDPKRLRVFVGGDERVVTVVDEHP